MDNRGAPLSRYNRDIRLDGGRPKVWFREITLRQQYLVGDAAPAISEKVAWVLALDKAGVQRTAFFGTDPDVLEVISQVRAAGAKIAIELQALTYVKNQARQVIETARTCGADIGFYIRSSDNSVAAMGWSRSEMLASSIEAVKPAKDAGLTVTLGASYGSDADESFLREFCAAVEVAGADIIEVPDSLGVASPVGMHHLISLVRASTKLPIRVHCHDDFGLAVANVIAAIEAGAEAADVVVNGMDPHRSGIASLEGVVAALECLYGVDTGIDLAQLTWLSRLHERMTGMHPASNRPLVGRLAFATVWAEPVPGKKQGDDHWLPFDPPPFDPSIVGNARRLVLGRVAGQLEIAQWLTERGYSLNDDQLGDLVRLVQDQARSMKRAVTDEELTYLVGMVKNSKSQQKLEVAQ